jgi:hypothetical protein
LSSSVAGPAEVGERLDGARGELDVAAAGPSGGMPGERDDVVGPLPQGRHLHDGVHQGGQGSRDVLEPLGSDGEQDARRGLPDHPVVPLRRRGRPRQRDEIAQALGRPHGQRLDVADHDGGVRLSELG